MSKRRNVVYRCYKPGECAPGVQPSGWTGFAEGRRYSVFAGVHDTEQAAWAAVLAIKDGDL